MASSLDTTNLEQFIGFSYVLLPLVDFLARRWRKRQIAALWPSITRISLLRFEPSHRWEWLTWRRRQTGKLISIFAKEPQKWSELVSEENVDTSHIPSVLKKNLSFLPLFILVFPHRYDRAVQKLLEDWCFSRGADLAQRCRRATGRVLGESMKSSELLGIAEWSVGLPRCWDAHRVIVLWGICEPKGIEVLDMHRADDSFKLFASPFGQ